MRIGRFVLGTVAGVLLSAGFASATTFTLNDCNAGSGLANPCGPIGSVIESYDPGTGTLSVSANANSGYAFGSGDGAIRPEAT